MKKFTPNNIFQFLGNLSGLIGLILQCFNFNGTLSMLAGILISLCILYNIVVWILYRINHRVSYSRREHFERGRKVINLTRNKIVFYGGDLSWTKDYLTEINKIIDRHKEVLVFYPENKKDLAAENIKKLESLGSKVKPLPVDYGLRFTLVDPDNPEDTIVFLTNRVSSIKVIDKKTDIEEKFTTEVYDRKTDPALVNSFTRTYKLASDIANAYEQSKNKG